MTSELLSRAIILVAMLLVGMPIIFGIVGWVWNKKYVPSRQAKGQIAKPFGRVMSEINKYTFKEDSATLAKKAPKLVQKILSVRIIHVMLMVGGSIGFVLTGQYAFLLTFPVSFILGISRAVPMIKKRGKVLERIFAIASNTIKFSTGPRGKNAAPVAYWNHIQVEKWEGVEPSEFIITYPTGQGPNKNAQDAFDKTFKENVTDEHDWFPEWDLTHDRVTIKSVPNLPTSLPYPGSQQSKWSVFPVGEGKGGIASFDVATFPHVLVGGPSGTGKALALNTPVLTQNKGWVTIHDLQVGDTVFGVDGNPTTVTHLHPIITPAKAYEVEFRNGEKIIADADHLWETETTENQANRLHYQNGKSNLLKGMLLPQNVIASLTEIINSSDSTTTISIPEMALMTGLLSDSKQLHTAAKQVGPAEEIHTTHKYHYNPQIVTQTQAVTRLPFASFVEWFNDRAENAPTHRLPLLKGHYDKLNQLAYEVNETDILTVDSVVEYVDAWQKISADWFHANADRNMNPVDMVEGLRAKAENFYSLLPSQILVAVKHQTGYVSQQEVASLLGVEPTVLDSTWNVALTEVAGKAVQTEQIDIFSSEETISERNEPFFTYPAVLFAQKLLDNSTILWGKQSGHAIGAEIRTTQEIADLMAAGNTVQTHYVRKATAVHFPEKDVPVQPYILGTLLVDSSSVTDVQGNMSTSLHTTMTATLLECKAANNVIGRIPETYFTSSETQRRELLRGILDVAGAVNSEETISFITTDESSMLDVKRLVASLGYLPYVELQPAEQSYVISFLFDPQDTLFQLASKNSSHRERYNAVHAESHVIVAVRPVEPAAMRCLTVNSPDRLFLVGDSLIPTHNSVLQRNMVFHTIQHNDRWRFLGVDLKRVELTPYNKYKKTVMGIATEIDQGLEVLKYAYNEMMDRYKMMEGVGVNNVMDLEDPPYCILLMIDEATMFLGTSGSKTDEGKAEDGMKGEAADLVGKVLRLGRASGIHMVIAMQRPDAVVLRGEFKANMDVRLAAGRMDSTPSSMILDSGEAVNLPGIRGRGLIRVGGGLEVFQGYFAPPEWIDDYILKNPTVEPSTVAPGGHLYEKYQAQLRLEAAANAEAGSPEQQSQQPAPSQPQPQSPVQQPAQPQPATPVTDYNLPDFTKPELVAEVSPNQQNLFDALKRKPEDLVPDASERTLPAFFTGGSAPEYEEAHQKPLIEPDLDLSPEDFILDDFDDDLDEVVAPVTPQPVAEAPKVVKWTPVSPFGAPPVTQPPAASKPTPAKVPTPATKPAPLVAKPATPPVMPTKPSAFPARPKSAGTPAVRPVSPFQTQVPKQPNGNNTVTKPSPFGS